MPMYLTVQEEGKMSWTVSDAVNYKGFPADKSKTGGWITASLILGIEICERLSTMGIAVNLVTYLVGTMHVPSAESANIVTDFLGTSFMLCLLGGFLADSFLGRFRTIAIFAVIQALGTGLLSVSTKLPQFRPLPCNAASQSCQEASDTQMGVLYLCLYLIALGTGGLKSSVSGFGTDQFDDKDERERTQMTFFFNRFFFLISMGTLLAVTVLVYLQDEVGRSWAYGICCLSMVIAIVIFLSGTKRYRYKKSSGSPIVHILQVIVASFRKRNLKYDNLSILYEDRPEATRIPHTQQYLFLDKAAIRVEGDDMIIDGKVVPNAWRLCSVSRVEEVKMMIWLLPVWATTILFWTIYAQMITFSVVQASTMERMIGTFQIPAGSLTVFFVGAILMTLAVYDRVIMPLFRRWKGTEGFTNLQKIGIGLAMSIVGMIVAALTERKRLSVARNSGSVTTLPMSVFTLIPQFFLVGSGEAFIYTGQLDFFITRSPKGMKTLSTGLFLTTLSLGFFLSSFLVSVIKSVTGHNGEKSWLADNINEGRLDYFYGLLALLSTINLVVYLVCAIFTIKPQSQSRALTMNNGEKNSLDDKC
ncbi:protein NRT1/ PTR FAMILY 6.2-like protein [Carex littledalei]|uniref:Protein NRT1/ PTR FAMILY 6.2-like protein n=1 Tax=Carex littledalei TaxID=544730 RepID=A0A833QLB5_9POAL|nr:protein NRT1/ PTR FAMILY 6.2-like protein [Carex littledalei]